MISSTVRVGTLALAAIVCTGGHTYAQGQRSAQVDADQKEVYSYVLTLDKIQKLAAVQKDLAALEKSNPQLAKAMNADDSSAQTLNQMAQKIDKVPQVVAVLTKNGLTSREYAVATMTLLQAGMAVGMKKAGTYKEYPPSMLELVSTANLQFVEKNYDQISKTMPVAENDDQK